MRKRFYTVATIVAISVSMFMTSCIGSFTLTNKLLSWNRQISNKFVNELVFFVFWFLPVYEVASLADVLVLNSIEFWSGENPVAKKSTIIDGENGKYHVMCDGKGYTIKSELDGSVVRLEFDVPSQSWSYIDNEGNGHVFLQFVDDTHVKMPTINGDYQVVELSQAGVYAYRNANALPLFAKN